MSAKRETGSQRHLHAHTYTHTFAHSFIGIYYFSNFFYARFCFCLNFHTLAANKGAALSVKWKVI